MKKISVVLLSVLLAVPAFAEDVSNVYGTDAENITNTVVQNTVAKNPQIKFPHGLQFGVGVSPTSGLNGFIGYNNKKFDSFWAKRFGIRFDFASFSPVKNRLNRRINDMIGNEGIEIEEHLSIENVTLNAKHYGAMIDFYPFGDTWFLGGWRLSGGYMAGKLDLDANILGKNLGGGEIEFELNDHKYYYTGNEMHGRAMLDWKYNGPYVGTGFDLGLFWGFKIYLDAGVVFADKSAKIDLDVPLTNLYDENHQPVSGDNALISVFNTAKAAAIYEAQKELDKYPYYPLVKIGFMYRF